MKNGRPMDDWQRPLDILAEAPLEWLIRFAIIPLNQFPRSGERSAA